MSVLPIQLFHNSSYADKLGENINCTFCKDIWLMQTKRLQISPFVVKWIVPIAIIGLIFSISMLCLMENETRKLTESDKKSGKSTRTFDRASTMLIPGLMISCLAIIVISDAVRYRLALASFMIEKFSTRSARGGCIIKHIRV